jgi:hypothetical protein
MIMRLPEVVLGLLEVLGVPENLQATLKNTEMNAVRVVIKTVVLIPLLFLDSTSITYREHVSP